jgi:hypothetical protein
VQFASWGAPEAGDQRSAIASATKSLQNQLSASGPCDGSTILFSYTGGVLVGLYAGKKIDTTGGFCSLIVANNGITVAQIESFNAQTWGWQCCSNVQLGQVICLSTGEYLPLRRRMSSILTKGFAQGILLC